ncbi:hypothetical protein LARV_03857 [Longilinea arvoryzae]|uniref:Uncharacterized protein n=1 Tax=Longilinea arvoryzae TaxID=360412 RepID=A0A0K8MYE5_9CHLR|nr:hypothetical protein [Longilinea arvoryzae]GAP16061.1 hypothetical protein LARV_03857 [Longilinea arvoryzae]
MNTNFPSLTVNGFIVVEDDQGVLDVKYRGIYGIVWPLKSLPSVEDPLLEESLGIDHYLKSGETIYAEVTTNWEATLKYWEYCRSKMLLVRLLRIETILPMPFVSVPPKTQWEFLGYDVSCVSGDFYSAIHQDLLVRTLGDLQKWKNSLNKNKLFDDFQTASDFLLKRALLGADKIETIGDFFVVRLFNYVS